MTSFKIYFSEDNIRRIRVDEIPSYEEFVRLLQDLYPKFHPELKVKYVDADGDKISIDSQIEWEWMLVELQNETSIKLWVEESATGFYFKDAMEPENLKFYADKATKQALDATNDFFAHLQKNVPDCLSGLFKDGKIIPSHIPEFLREAEAVSTRYISENVVDLDIDIQRLFDSLHAKALGLLDSVNVHDLEQAREYLLATLKIVPDHMIALYNLACAESLLGNVNAAIESLEKSVESGYRNLTHMLQDADFENIRNTEAFQVIAAKVASLIDMVERVQEMPQLEEEVLDVIPEPIIEPVVPESTPVDLSESIFPLKERFTTELELLNEMGFSADADVLLLLLEQFDGNVDSVAQFLLGFTQ